ncbi:MAG: hypothetical protein J2P57_14955 [Acidimicrobiaceae bacterium]|nr:hypothetical protein [Acidimicrobiaceae bacterium]
MDQEDLAWAAGLFDAEGCVNLYARNPKPTVRTGLYRGKKGPRLTRRTPNLRLVVFQHHDPTVLARFVAALGIGNVYGPGIDNRNGAKRYQVEIGNFRAVEALQLLWPYLSGPKRNQAQAALEAYQESLRDRPVYGSKPRALDLQFTSECAHGVVETELAWAAGLFDGEGHTGWGRTLRVDICQYHDASVLDRFVAAVGIGKVYGPWVDRRSGAKKYAVEIDNYRSVEVLRLIWPYMSEPKQWQARVAAESFHASLAGRNYGPRMVDLRFMWPSNGLYQLPLRLTSVSASDTGRHQKV